MSAKTKARPVEQVWHGPESLRPFLTPVESLRPHPKNPRRGVVPEIQKSLARFGQQRPVLALPDGTLVAGHHVWKAADAEGWTHLAVVRSDLGEADVEAYLLADNRLADLGLYDDQALAELLLPLYEDDALAGIGYGREDVEELLSFLGPVGLETAPRHYTPAEAPYALGESEMYRIMLTFDRPTYEQLVERLDGIAEARGLDSYSEVVLELAADAAD